MSGLILWLLMRVHCSNVNKLLRHQIRDVASHIRGVSKGAEKPGYSSSTSRKPRPDEAYTLALQYFVKLLVQEIDLVSGVFVNSSNKNEPATSGSSARCKFASETQLLLEGFQQELFKLADWAASLNPMLCVPMLGESLWYFFLLRPACH